MSVWVSAAVSSLFDMRDLLHGRQFSISGEEHEGGGVI